MRVLLCIAHYFPVSGERHDIEGSSQDGLEKRRDTVVSCIRQWSSLLAEYEFLLGSEGDLSEGVNNVVVKRPAEVHGDVFLCTNRDNHVFHGERVVNFKSAQERLGHARHLPYLCRRVFMEYRDQYDLFIYAEDDTVALDPEFFRKILDFYAEFGDRYLLLPNRYELFSGLSFKVYLENDSPEGYRVASSERGPDRLTTRRGAELARTDSPYVGFYAVTRSQLRDWSEMPAFSTPTQDFNANDLEQAMVPMLGRRPIYRPSRRNMAHLEVHHTPNRACHARVPRTRLIASIEGRDV